MDNINTIDIVKGENNEFEIEFQQCQKSSEKKRTSDAQFYSERNLLLAQIIGNVHV